MTARRLFRSRPWPLLVAVVGVLALVVTTGNPAVADTSASPVQIMHIVAHPDDDLFFMNPDVYQAVRSGQPTVTVYVTASEISGNGNTPAQKARSLQRGVEDAYARMAGVPDVDPNAQEEWTGQAWTIGTRKVEKYTLTAQPGVQLVFMNLRDAFLGDVYDSGLNDRTIIPTGGTVTASYRYRKADVNSVLLGIMNSYQPTVLRYQDVYVDDRYLSDHLDHYAAARFARDAAAAYTLPLLETSYRDYNIADATENLSQQAVLDKTFFFETYAEYDGMASDFFWLTGMYYRWPRGTQWVGKTGDGRPQAFVVRKGVINTWSQAADGTWAAPVALPGAGGAVLPSVAAITNTNGTLQVFARRLTDHHVITLKQTVPNGAWATTWTDLGNPNEGAANIDQIGVPTVVANADGTLWMLVKDGNGGVCARRQNPNGSWGGWLDLGGGSDVQDQLAAIRGNDGRVEVFASTRSNVLTWRQTAPNGDLVETGSLPSIPGVLPASAPSVTKNQDGTLEVLYRAEKSDMVTTFQTAVGGSWNPNPVMFGGQGGLGQPAAVTAPPGSDARIMVFERNEDTGVSMSKQSAPDSAYEAWNDLGGTIVDYPAAIVDGAGAVVLFAVGTDGKLYVRKQTSPGANSPFTAWQGLG